MAAVNGEDPFARSAALLGDEVMARLRRMHVAVVGVGGVGSWCAEALARTGVGRLTLFDGDAVAISNLNRQCEAAADTVGERKVSAMLSRLLAVAPGCEVTAVDRRIGGFADLEADRYRYDFIVDAIDDVAAKAELILGATEAGVPIVSSMGAARRTDPTRVELRRFDKVEGDALARALRQRFRKLNRFPAVKFECAVSSEPPAAIDCLGSVMPVTCAFGMALASAVIAGARRSSSAAEGNP